MTWQRAMWAGAFVSAPIFVGVAGGREWGDRRAAHGAAADSTARAAAPVAVAEVAGVVTLAGGGRVEDAVVYLEPLDAPRAAVRPAAARVVPVARPALPAAAPAPRDTVRLLWGAVRELSVLVRDLRDRVAAVRAGDAARADAAAPRTPALAAVDSAARGETLRAEAARVEAARADAERAAAARPPEPAAPAPPRPEPLRAEILMRQKTFLPHVRVVGTGGTVEWPNRDPFSHNVFSNTPGGTFDLGLYPRGESRGAAFRRPGVYEVFCNIHPRMSAYVVAVPSPFHTRPAGGGRFSFAAVPAGRYRVRVWHERARAPFAQEIAVTERGAPRVVAALDAREYRAAAHLNKFGQPYARTARDEY
jgi:plastocyanin